MKTVLVSPEASLLLFGPKYLLDQNFFFGPKYFFKMNLFGKQIFFYQICLQQKILFSDCNFVDQLFFLDQHLFWTNLFFRPKSFGFKKILGSGVRNFEVGDQNLGLQLFDLYLKPKYRILAPYEAQNPSKNFRQVVGGWL